MVYHRARTGTDAWNLRSRADLEIASGLYLYKVEQFDDSGNIVDWKLGKFLVVR